MHTIDTNIITKKGVEYISIIYSGLCSKHPYPIKVKAIESIIYCVNYYKLIEYDAFSEEDGYGINYIPEKDINFSHEDCELLVDCEIITKAMDSNYTVRFRLDDKNTNYLKLLREINFNRLLNYDK